ncbi:hypothetical protein [Wohlfahrtiimonas populi]|uniref:hypothetical protein n=1 Tax=Wohlfahrtiimonas populi TaxID=1940240 RepID=UPI00098D4E44|nr:hypothetical protein [Wohlfahrtiimonas populi]
MKQNGFQYSVIALFLSACIGQVSVAQLDHKGLTILDKAESVLGESFDLPESQWFGRDKTSANADIDDYLDDLIERLELPELVGLRQNYFKVEKRIGEERKTLRELREKRLFSVSEEASTLMKYTPTDTLKTWTASTRADFDQLIEAHEKNLVELEKSLLELRSGMSDELAKAGVKLDPEQLDFLYTTVTGEDTIRAIMLFNSATAVSKQLQHLMETNAQDFDAVKRYYGMATILHRMVVKIQENFIYKLEKIYMVQLDTYKVEAKKSLEDAKRLKATADREQRKVLDKNIEANQLALEAIDRYMKYLQDQAKNSKAILKKAQSREAIAMNTYSTVKVSLDVLSLMQDSQRDFQAFSTMQVPEIATFDNPEIRKEFLNITQKLNGS